MALPKTLTTSGTSTSAICPLNCHRTPFSVSVITTLSGSATYSLQFTGDEAILSTPTNWQNHPNMTGSTVADTVEFTSPVTAIRIDQTSGAGGVTAKVIQA